MRTNVIEQTLEDKKGLVVSFTSPTHESEFDGLALEHLSGWSEHADLQPLLVARGVKAAACPTAFPLSRGSMQDLDGGKREKLRGNKMREKDGGKPITGQQKHCMVGPQLRTRVRVVDRKQENHRSIVKSALGIHWWRKPTKPTGGWPAKLGLFANL